MKSLRNKLFKCLRYLCLAGVVALGLMTTLATFHDDDAVLVQIGQQPVNLTRLRGIPATLFYNLNVSTGASTRLSGFGLGDFSVVSGLAFDTNTNTQYGSDTFFGVLVTINPATGAGTIVGPLGFPNVQGLAFDPNTNTLYGFDTVTLQLITINPATGAGTVVGPLGIAGAFVTAIAFDPNTNTLYGFNNTTNQLITINTNTGAGAVVGAALGIGGAVISGLTFDANANILYGSDTGNFNLVTIATATGVGAVVGAFGAAATVV